MTWAIPAERILQHHTAAPDRGRCAGRTKPGQYRSPSIVATQLWADHLDNEIKAIRRKAGVF